MKFITPTLLKSIVIDEEHNIASAQSRIPKELSSRQQTLETGVWYIQQVPENTSHKTCQAFYSSKKCEVKLQKGMLFVLYLLEVNKTVTLSRHVAGSWCLTVKGSRKIHGRTKPEVFWFCADTKCTRTDICVTRVTGYVWGTTQQCAPGSVVKVIGDIPSDVQRKLSSGPMALWLDL